MSTTTTPDLDAPQALADLPVPGGRVRVVHDCVRHPSSDKLNHAAIVRHASPIVVHAVHQSKTGLVWVGTRCDGSTISAIWAPTAGDEISADTTAGAKR